MANSYTDAHGVYRNKLGITDAAELKRIEYNITAARGDEILFQNALGHPNRHDLKRLQAIHHHLFQDVYEWAGKLRTVPSSKRLDSSTVSVFANPETFAPKWQELENKTAAFALARNLTAKQKLDALVEIFIEANHVHPFPEGNGRSLQVFMRELARDQGVALDYTKTSAREWNRASAISGVHGKLFERQYLIPESPDRRPIKEIFSQMASPALAFEQDRLSERTATPEAAMQVKPDAIAKDLTATGLTTEQQAVVSQHCRDNAQWLHEQNPQPGLDAERNRNAPDAHAEPRMGLANLSNRYAYMQALTPSATSQPLHATLPEREAYRQSEPDNGPEP